MCDRHRPRDKEIDERGNTIEANEHNRIVSSVIQILMMQKSVHISAGGGGWKGPQEFLQSNSQMT